MRILSWLLPILLIAPLLWVDDSESCIRFKKPGGSVDPGMRDPSDPDTPTTEEPDSPDTPTTPTTPTTPVTPVTPTTPTTTPNNKPSTTTGGGGRKGPAVDNSTWETWWELNRPEFFPRRWVGKVISPEEGQRTRSGPQPLHAKVVQTKLWKMLMKTIDDPQPFVQEAAAITMGRVAANEEQREKARELLLKKLKHRNHLVARAAALGLFYVADDKSVYPMYQIAKNEKIEEDVRAFLALTLTNLNHPMAGELLKQLADVKKGYHELVAAALMAIGYTGAQEEDPSATVEYLSNLAFKTKSLKHISYRALAVESIGRIGNLELGLDPIMKGLTDRDANVRRSAAFAAGALDYRTEAERKIEAIKAPYEEWLGIPMSPEDEARIATLEELVPGQRAAMVDKVKRMVKELGKVIQKDGDVFAKRIALISLGRIYQQNPQNLAARFIDGQLKKDRIGTREYALLAGAIGNIPGIDKHVFRYTEERNPSTRGAGCVAAGLLGNKDRVGGCSGLVRAKLDAKMREIVAHDVHPVIRGYAALGAGMIGSAGSAPVILKMVRTTKMPQPRGYGALGLALLGTKQGADDIVGFIKSRDQMVNGFVASHMVYALGLTKDRRPTTFDTLVAKSLQKGDMYVQAASLAAIGYLATGEYYPRRHLMASGYNYMLGMDYIDTYFYKL